MASSSKAAAPAPEELSRSFKFFSAGLAGVMGWIVVHPFNTVALRMNLSIMSGGSSEKVVIKKKKKKRRRRRRRMMMMTTMMSERHGRGG